MASYNRYVVGLFDSTAEAKSVEADLGKARFDTGHIHTHSSDKARNLTGELKRHGVPDRHAHFYAEGVRRGGTLVTVSTDDQHYNNAVEIMRRHGAADIQRRASYFGQSGFKQYDEQSEPYSQEQIDEDHRGEKEFDYDTHRAQGTTVLPETEEHLSIGKERIEGEGVRIFTREYEEPVEGKVNLREEHIDVERRNVDRPATAEDEAAARKGEVTMRETKERPVVSKEKRVTEEVHVGKHGEEHTETVRDTAKKTEVEVERTQGANKGAKNKSGR
ncbi:MAG: YsnF/AvaK domain-containing protein [Phycisphaerae bacterium]